MKRIIGKKHAYFVETNALWVLPLLRLKFLCRNRLRLCFRYFNIQFTSVYRKKSFPAKNQTLRSYSIYISPT